MTRVAATTIVFCVASAALAQGVSSGQLPNPAIVRIITPENDGSSYGSGALVAVDETYGLVVTNWHVVRDAAAPVWVAFPDGFCSPAAVLKTDRDWDLAALAVWRPNATPLQLASKPPRPGERLTIAGYGSGSFRAVSGQCTQYVSPGENHPYEMIELSAPARNGDSGGPILNDRGEVAGVLFGSAYGRTTGSYCGRLRNFLASASGDFQRLPGRQTAIAKEQSAPLVPVAAISATPKAPISAAANSPGDLSSQTVHKPSASIALSGNKAPFSLPANAKSPAASIRVPPSAAASPWFEQLRNYMALIGLVAILMQGLRAARKLVD